MISELINRSSVRMPRKFLRHWIAETSRALKQAGHGSHLKQKELVVVFVDPREMITLNHQYRRKKRPTDILSFSPIEVSSFGELVICPQVIREQAKETKLSYYQELGYMIVHGYLHLLGYEHERGGAEAQKMFALQERLFASVARRCNLR